MAAGDISDALLARLRAILDEATAGFWTDPELFSFMTESQNFIIDVKALRYVQAYNVNRVYDDPILRPLITSSSVAWDTSANSITLPTYRTILYAEMLKSSTGATLPMTMLGYDEMLLRKNNGYIGHSFNDTAGTGQVFYYIGDKLYTSFPTGTHSAYYDKITVVYLKNVSDMTTSVDPTLGAECYNGIIEYAAYRALQKDNRYSEAGVHLQNFFKWLGV